MSITARRLLGPSLWLLCAISGCDKSEERITTLESRIAALEQKQSEQDKALLPLAKLPEDHKAVGDKVTALQMSDAQTAETIAAMQRDLASVQEKIAILATPGTMSVEPGAAKSSGSIGIPECDEYVTKYMKCIESKVPEAARETMKDAMAETVKAWKEAARGPARKALGPACKAALDAAEAATESMGCEW